MINVEQAVSTALLASTALQAIVADRVWTDIADEDPVFPFVHFTRTATTPVTTIHDGEPVASKVEMTVSSWAHASIDANAMADAATIALRDLSVSTNRFTHYDEQVDATAVVVVFEIWDV